MIVGIEDYSVLKGQVEPGDLLLEINGKSPRDLVDYLILQDEENLEICVRRKDQEVHLQVTKPLNMGLGLLFERPFFDQMMTCNNRCIFCFVDQLPPGLRPSLYVKDDDYRLSFFDGNFVTLTNVSRAEISRIARLRLSPLYFSLHTTDPQLRDLMLGTRNSRRSLRFLRYLISKGIEVHLQVVLCPGINDGKRLKATFEDLLKEYPAASVGVVPVGLTRYSERLPVRLQPVDSTTASEVLDLVERYQRISLKRWGRRMFFAADELYLMVGEELPSEEEYDGYPQLENGIGLSRKFIQEMEGALRRHDLPAPSRRTIIVTGRLGEKVLRMAFRRSGMNKIPSLKVLPVENRMLGDTITVSGLLSGGDLIASLRKKAEEKGFFLVPSVMLREGFFLDGLSCREVEDAIDGTIQPVEARGGALIEQLHRI